jgi:glycosyltransferase involved in cell wall biosynthesis
VFNRPRQVKECLDSIVADVERLSTEAIEVWVTDDASTDGTASVARDFAHRYSWIGFCGNNNNLGLERNLVQSIEPCRGRFIWLIGSDDLIAPNGLRTVLEEVKGNAPDVLLFNKQRVDRSLERMVPDAQAHVPLGVSPGEIADFDNPLELARLSGFVSAFGFTSQVLWRRSRIQTFDPSPYVGLMMYPHLGLLLEAYSRSPVRFRNQSVVLQRTLTAEQKLVESIGTAEESFMAGGEERNRRWFGAGYAALLQRAVDRSEVVATDFWGLPERLFSEESMLDFIARNWRAAVDVGLIHDGDVIADAVRLFESLGMAIPGVWEPKDGAVALPSSAAPARSLADRRR